MKRKILVGRELEPGTFGVQGSYSNQSKSNVACDRVSAGPAVTVRPVPE